LKKKIILLLLPLLQFYIRKFPTPIGKKCIYDFLFWRDLPYKTKTKFSSKVKGRLNDLVQGHIYFFGIWEPNLTHFIQSRLSKCHDRTFIDVGANIGYFTMLAAECMPSGRIVAIEALPTIYNHLVEHIRSNNYNNVRTVNFAASDNECEVTLYQPNKNNIGHTTFVKGDNKLPGENVVGKPLSYILNDCEIDSTRVIKIDVEGAEYSVVKGMLSIIDQFPNDVEIVIEISPLVLTDIELKSLLAQFTDRGFNPYILENIYRVERYISPKIAKSFPRMVKLPEKQTDVIFSRYDGPSLLLD
jgi:FkbM family methyltransferase